MTEQAATPPAPAEVLTQVAHVMATDSRDWGQGRRDAWYYGVFVGWDCEDQHEHDWICGGQEAMAEQAAKHGWSETDVARLRSYRAAIAEVQSP